MRHGAPHGLFSILLGLNLMITDNPGSNGVKERNWRSEAFAFVIRLLPLCDLIQQSDDNSDRKFDLSRSCDP